MNLYLLSLLPLIPSPLHPLPDPPLYPGKVTSEGIDSVQLNLDFHIDQVRPVKDDVRVSL